MYFFSYEAAGMTQFQFLLCATSVSSVSLWLISRQLVNHRDTEDTEVAQRNQIQTLPGLR
jgi:hypothetical protein